MHLTLSLIATLFDEIRIFYMSMCVIVLKERYEAYISVPECRESGSNVYRTQGGRKSS